MLVIVAAAWLYAFTYNNMAVEVKQENEITLAEYNHRIINNDKAVLAYFSADWCVFCEKIEPVIGEIERDLGRKVEILRINTDRDKEIAKEFEVDALPILILYKNGNKAWVHVGMVDLKRLRAEVEAYL